MQTQHTRPALEPLPSANLSVLGLLLLCLSGCAGVAQFPEVKWPFSESEPEPYPVPVRMAVTWSPDILVQSGKRPTRGFGARVFFYDKRSKTVPVEGELIVHGFEEAAPHTPVTPTDAKRFRFTQEQFSSHFSQCDLGASYSIWIPWDVAGGQQRRVTLVATFTPSQGRPVQSESATVLLPGSAPPASETRGDALSRARRQRAADKAPKRGLQTTTIPLPESTQRRLNHAPPSDAPRSFDPRSAGPATGTLPPPTPSGDPVSPSRAFDPTTAFGQP